MHNANFPATPSVAAAVAAAAHPPLAPALLRRRVARLRRLAPVGLLGLVLLNELVLARWTARLLGDTAELALRILIYGSVGPLLAHLLLTVAGHWLEERETSEAQSQALRRARTLAQRNHDLTDDALQTLFATSLALDNLAHDLPVPSPEAAQFREARQAINRAIELLYANQKQKKPGP